MAEQGITRSADERDADSRVLHQVLARVFGRLPSDLEMERWGARLARGISGRNFLAKLVAGRGFQDNPQVASKTPAGHFYSPVVDPAQVRDYVARVREARPEELHGVDFPFADMEAFWRLNADFIAATPFPEAPDGIHRYSFTAGPYRHGDSIVLRAMIHHYRPKRIIEIGSGYSTACMLDTMDELGLRDLAVTCIEPNPERLFEILRPEDHAMVTLHQKNVQDVPVAMFSALQADDIVFIDSSHVLKTGSDVHYELFSILPALAPGVIVHFHDCRFPLEYSDRQIFIKNYSWNEVYAVRALLMYSTRFKVVFSASLFDKVFPELTAQCPAMQINPGAALWIRVQG